MIRLALAQMLRALVDEFDGGVLKPLPCRVFPIEDAINAFRTMSEAKHVGKIVISQKESPATRIEASATRVCFAPIAAYLITGGFGALGLLDGAMDGRARRALSGAGRA